MSVINGDFSPRLTPSVFRFHARLPPAGIANQPSLNRRPVLAARDGRQEEDPRERLLNVNNKSSGIKIENFICVVHREWNSKTVCLLSRDQPKDVPVFCPIHACFYSVSCLVLA